MAPGASPRPERRGGVALAALALLWVASARGAGPPGCPSCGMPTPAPGTERPVLLELAKRHLLEKLHLSERPRGPRPASRAAVAEALRHLPVGQARRDGLPGPFADWHGPDADEPAYEIISFAETEPSLPSGAALRFQFSRGPGRAVHLLQAQLWVHLEAQRGGPPQVTLRVSRAGALLGEKRLEAGAGGWHAFALLPALRDFFRGPEPALRLELECRGCPPNATAGAGASGSRRPFLVAKATAREPGRPVAKRSLRCEPNARLCCRQDYYMDFRDIGWDDWIVRPEGYQINYCLGQCPLHVASSPGMAASSHTAIFSLLRAHKAQMGGQSCCVPTRRRPLSVLYFDRNSNIVKKDIPDMIVEACGCS